MTAIIIPELQKDPANTVNAGTCATVALVIPAIGSLGPRLAIGNVGDARGIMVSAGTAERITVDHEPSLDSEKARIKAAGGYVDEDGRVNGYIMVSRSLGDFSGKSNPRLPSESQLISNEPTVSIRNLGEADEMAILASDGIWGVYVGDQDVANFVLGRIWRGVAIPKILEELLETIYLLTKGTSRCDNKTVMIVAFVKPNETEADWIARVQRTMRARLPPGHENWEARDGVNHEGLLTCELTAKKPGLGFKKKTGEVKP